MAASSERYSLIGRLPHDGQRMPEMLKQTLRRFDPQVIKEKQEVEEGKELLLQLLVLAPKMGFSQEDLNKINTYLTSQNCQ